MTISVVTTSGIAGTFAMSAFTWAVYYFFKQPYRVIRILGNMMRFQKVTPLITAPPTGSYIAAFLLHYIIGVIFAWGYHAMILNNLLVIDVLHAILYGVIIGTIGITGWYLFFALHLGPPAVNLAMYLPVIWLGHIVLAVVTFCFYCASVPPSIVSTIPLCG